MRKNKNLLQRLLILYVALFIVVVAGLFNAAPAFLHSASQGYVLGEEMAELRAAGHPSRIYLLPGLRLREPLTLAQMESDQSDGRRSTRGVHRTMLSTREVDLTVSEQTDPETSPLRLAFGALGGEVWIYLLAFCAVWCVPAIIVLMALIIISLRRSIRREQPLEQRNVRLLRIIGALTILSTLLQWGLSWTIARRGAELLAGSSYVVETQPLFDTTNLVMGILVLFSAEVFALGRRMSEEQQYTI